MPFSIIRLLKWRICKKKLQDSSGCDQFNRRIVHSTFTEGIGCEEVIVLNGEVDGKFAHNPEPLPENLSELSAAVRKNKADLGIAVDPDVDRLCFVCEDGSMFGEEYTLVAVADYVLGKRPGNTVSNMSSTKALKEITLSHGGQYYPSAVGEVNVVTKMKEVNAVIGGEGNGGIIVPDLHYGRDALIGIALFLSSLSNHRNGMKSFRAQISRLLYLQEQDRAEKECERKRDIRADSKEIQKTAGEY